jgi:hypothetical protein
MAQVLMPQGRQKDDALSTLIKGLGIASQVYGIKANMAQLDEYSRKQQQEQDLAEGKYNKNQQVQLSEKFDITRDQPAEGNYQTASDAETGGPLYLSLKKDSSPLVQHVRGMKNGVDGTYLVDGKTNKELGFYAAPLGPVKTREVEYTDSEGNKFKQIVEDKPGQKFAVGKSTPALASDAKFKALPPFAQEEIKILANKSANKIDIASQMDSELKKFKEAYEKGDQTQALKAGEGMLKLLNSAQGSDAVGAEESERLGSLLKYQIFNFTGSGNFFGRDLEGFYEQVSSKSNALKDSVAANKRRIEEIYSGGYKNEIPQTEEPLSAFGSKSTDGKAIASPNTPAYELTDEDRAALEFVRKNPNHKSTPGVIQALKKKGL